MASTLRPLTLCVADRTPLLGLQKPGKRLLSQQPPRGPPLPSLIRSAGPALATVPVRNGRARDPERLASYRMPQPRQSRAGSGRNRPRLTHPIARVSARPRVNAASRRLELDRLEKPVRPSCGQRCASIDACNPDCQRTSTRASGAYQLQGKPVSRTVHAARARFGRPPRLSRSGVVTRTSRRAPTSGVPSPPRPTPFRGVEPRRPRLLALRSRENPQRSQPGTPRLDEELRGALRRSSRSRVRPALDAASPCGREALGLGPPHRTSRNRPGIVTRRRRSSIRANTKEHGHTHERSDLARAVAFSAPRTRHAAASGEAPQLAPRLVPRRHRAPPDGLLAEQHALAAQRPTGQRARRLPVIGPDWPQAWMPATGARTDRGPLPTGRANEPAFHGPQTPRPAGTGIARASRLPRQRGAPRWRGRAA